ncbi:hypothetical protein AMTR_s00006p00267900 [Amborella trichopoda]|uniref:Uncharacterized protein n=1 Tax=Amborella trichopoda TaxID=13333 RepID=W1PD77_AMBTC|nr:hypothetical protein AMTR_s00006p00267900 [Amborella trichopoda]
MGSFPFALWKDLACEAPLLLDLALSSLSNEDDCKNGKCSEIGLLINPKLKNLAQAWDSARPNLSNSGLAE